jgi:hypothetical protein
MSLARNLGTAAVGCARSDVAALQIPGDGGVVEQLELVAGEGGPETVVVVLERDQAPDDR